MRVFIIGSKNLSVWMLNTLIEQGHEVIGALSRDLEPGMKPWLNELGHASLRDECKRHNIPCYEGMNVNSDKAIDILVESNLDVIFSCFWGQIIKQKVLDIPRLGIYNLHTAHLPLNRGSRPIPWAIIKGELYTGITLHKMHAGVDNGPILGQVKVEITEAETAKTLYEKVTKAGAQLFKNLLPSFDPTVKIKLVEQDESQATYQPRGEPFGGQINRSWSKIQTERFKRAFTFPPFRAYRYPPKLIGSEALPYFVIDDNCTSIELPQPHAQFRQDSIGSKQLREDIRNIIPSKAQNLCFDRNLDGMFPIHDILRQSGIDYCMSKQTNATEWFKAPLKYQPYRYQNGLLEIPTIRLNTADELVSILDVAHRLANECEYDIFIGINPIELISKEDILKQIRLSEIDELTFTEVNQLFDTEYEDISA